MIPRFLCGDSVRFGNLRFVGFFIKRYFSRVSRTYRTTRTQNSIEFQMSWPPSNGTRNIGVCKSNYVLCMPISSVNTKICFEQKFRKKQRRRPDYEMPRRFRTEKKKTLYINWSISSIHSSVIYLHRWWMCDIACWWCCWWATSNHSIGCVHRKNSTLCARARAQKPLILLTRIDQSKLRSLFCQQ